MRCDQSSRSRTVERHAEHAADHRDRVRLRIVVEKLHLAGLGERLEQLARECVRRLTEGLHASRREGRRDELPQAGVVRWFEPEQAPALRVPERLPARVQRRHSDLFRRQHVTKVASETLVPKAAPDVLMPGDEPPLPFGVVEERDLFAKPVQGRIGICEKPGIRGVEIHRFAQRHGLTIGCRPPS